MLGVVLMFAHPQQCSETGQSHGSWRLLVPTLQEQSFLSDVAHLSSCRCPFHMPPSTSVLGRSESVSAIGFAESMFCSSQPYWRPKSAWSQVMLRCDPMGTTAEVHTIKPGSVCIFAYDWLQGMHAQDCDWAVTSCLLSTSGRWMCVAVATAVAVRERFPVLLVSLHTGKYP